LKLSSAEQSRFYAYLRANSLIQHVSVDPIRIEFGKGQAPGLATKPHIFLFVVDSLRRDYVSPYNSQVTFTPAIDRFAEDSVVFDRAFTRYGGTGLAVPSLWAGGMLLHKQYVTPFDPMNTLLRLIEAEGYRRMMSMDSIVVQLMPPPPEADEIDRGVPVVEYRLCRTLQDLTTKLSTAAGDRRPIFAYTLPQDIHISHVRSEPVPAGRTYPGFFPPAAAQIERMDACFGEFVHFLKRSRLYDDSVIILTSDHGDSLGEMLRWGHSYTMFPEVARIPLIVRVPERVREQFAVDERAVSLSTDITPTLYALLGRDPADLGPLYGRPLFVSRRDGVEPRTGPVLIASSYGGVYAVLHDNGSRMYIADGVNGRDYAYDLSGASPVRIGVTPATRADDQAFIRTQVDDISRASHFAAEP
jgi:arylsulfatase A-like enzyme